MQHRPVARAGLLSFGGSCWDSALKRPKGDFKLRLNAFKLKNGGRTTGKGRKNNICGRNA